MQIELRPGSGVAAFVLSLSTLLELEKKGTFAAHELVQVIEQSLGKLKELDAGPSLQSQEEWEFARDLLERLHTRLSRDSTHG
jgi:hypothetical protein